MKKIILLCFLGALLLAGCKQTQTEETKPPISATHIIQAIAENMTQPTDGS